MPVTVCYKIPYELQHNVKIYLFPTCYFQLSAPKSTAKAAKNSKPEVKKKPEVVPSSPGY